MTKLFPFTLAVLDFCAAMVYLYHGDYRQTIYWLAACTLTLSITV
jgi:hypothetical protein